MATAKESLRAFALRSKIDKSVLSRLVNGKLRRWDPEVVAKVSTATEKAVGLSEFGAFATRLKEQPSKIKLRRRRAA